MISPALTAALAYAADGLRVLPLEPPIAGDAQSGKRPITALCPSGVLSASADPATIRRWWAAHPDAGVGLAIPADWIVVDVDPRNGGVASYDALAAEHGGEAWPATLEAETGGGGAHLIYKIPDGARFPGKIAGRKGLDVKGLGGYIVVAPSGHYTGGSYGWVRETTPAPVPEWLASLERGVAASAGDPGASDRELTAAEQASLDSFAAIVEPHFELGQRNALALAVGGALRNAGLPPSAADYVIDQLPSTAPEKRLKDALGAWRAPVAKGMAALKEILPADAFASIEAVDLRPDWMRRAGERQAERARLNPQAGPASPVAHQGEAGTGSVDPPPDILGRRINLGSKPKPLAYLFERLPFAPGGKVNAIAGAPNAGKSPAALQMVLSHVTGKKCGPFVPLRKGWALYLDAETGELAHRRWWRICHAHGVDPSVGGIDFRDVEVMLSEAFCERLEGEIAAQGPDGLVVIDTYGAMLAADIDNNSPQFAHWLRMLGRMSRAHAVVIVVLIHHNKSAKGGGLEGIAGNYQGAGAMQGVITLERTGTENEDPIKVICSRAPESTFPAFQIKWEDVRSTPGQDLKDGTGLRAVVVDVGDAPALVDTGKHRAGVARSMLESLRRTPHQNKTKVVKGARGASEKEKVQIFDSLVDSGILLEVHTANRINGRGEAEAVLVYEVAPLSAAVVEARLKEGLVE